MPQILVVEDEIDLGQLIRAHLEAAGYEVTVTTDGLAALATVAARRPDLIVLDWMLPGMDGLAVCRQVRQSYLMPIIMLTARSEEIDRVLGLEVGADDYVVKPFSMRELLARVRAMLRRVDLDARQPPTGATTDAELPGALTRGPLTIDPTQHSATLDGAPLDLTPKEFDLLTLLVTYPNRAFSREYLLERLWGYAYDGADRTVDSHITRLRKKLGPLGDAIVTVWGVGYRLTI